MDTAPSYAVSLLQGQWWKWYARVTAPQPPLAECFNASKESGNDEDKITNNGSSAVDTHLLTVVRGLPRHARLANADGTSKNGDPYLRLFLNDGVLQPGQSAYAVFSFARPKDMARLNYTLELLSGQGNP